MSLRPFCCPEHACTPVFQLNNSVDISRFNGGKSFLCLGKMDKSVVFTYDKVIHANDLSTCVYTPLKGVIRFQENRGDWKGFIVAYTRALEKLDEEEVAPRGERGLKPNARRTASMAKKKEFTLDPARKGTLWADMTPSEQQYIKDRQKSDGVCQFKIPDIVWTTVGTCAWLSKGAYWPTEEKKAPAAEFTLDPARKGMAWGMMSPAEQAEIQISYNRAFDTVLILSDSGAWVRFNSPDRFPHRSYWPCDKPDPRPEPAHKAEYLPVMKLNGGINLSFGRASEAIVGMAGPSGTTVVGFAQTEKLAQKLVEYWRLHGRFDGGLDRLLHGRPLFEGKLRQPWAVCVEIPDDAFPTKEN